VVSAIGPYVPTSNEPASDTPTVSVTAPATAGTLLPQNATAGLSSGLSCNPIVYHPFVSTNTLAVQNTINTFCNNISGTALVNPLDGPGGRYGIKVFGGDSCGSDAPLLERKTCVDNLATVWNTCEFSQSSA